MCHYVTARNDVCPLLTVIESGQTGSRNFVTIRSSDPFSIFNLKLLLPLYFFQPLNHSIFLSQTLSFSLSYNSLYPVHRTLFLFILHPFYSQFNSLLFLFCEKGFYLCFFIYTALKHHIAASFVFHLSALLDFIWYWILPVNLLTWFTAFYMWIRLMGVLYTMKCFNFK